MNARKIEAASIVKDWYRHRDELQCEQVFRARSGEKVKLDRQVPGDGTRWYVADWDNGWFYMDSTVEPGDLKALLPKES
jgi:hypothetical protein